MNVDYYQVPESTHTYTTYTHTAMSIKFEDLEELLKNDNKVKVGGELGVSCNPHHDRCANTKAAQGVDIDGIVRGKYISKKKFMSSAKPSADFGFCSVIL